MTPKRILVLLGTDHHPFERLVAWADGWATSNPSTEILVQHGHTRPPSVASGVDFLSPADLRKAVEAADVVVTHGGPGTITDARGGGKKPILVPRDPRRGEHVDGHQQRFAVWVEKKRLVTVARETNELGRAILLELQRPSRVAEDASTGSGAADRLAALLLEHDRTAVTGPVVYITGSGRSGSTILEQVLGQDPRVVTLGEVHHLWERGIVKNELCGCGTPFRDCVFWSTVGDHAFGGWGRVNLRILSELANRVDRQRRVLKTGFPRMSRQMTRDTHEYTEYYRRIYQAALQVSGAEVVVDSGKHPSLALALSHNTKTDLRILHLVRDSLGVSYSWSKTMSRPEASSPDDAEMTRYSPERSSALWVTTNVEAEILRTRRLPFVRLRYESFVASPKRELDRVWGALNLPGAAPQMVGESGTITLNPTHTVAGNPARFSKGATALVSDRVWATRMHRRERIRVATLTAPLRAIYGYKGIE